MLPKQVQDLTEGFMRAFDSEHPAETEFRNAHQRFAESLAQRGFGWPSGAFAGIGRSVIHYLEAKAIFVWEKLQHVVTSTETEPYPELNADLKSEIAKHLGLSVQSAEDYLENLRRATGAPPGAPQQIKTPFDTTLLRINAEIDLFSATHAAQKKQVAQSANQVFNIQTAYGQVGNITKSQVEIADTSGNVQPSKAIGVSPEGPSSSIKLEVTASLSLENTNTRHGLLTIKALNSGTKVARIRRVAVLLVPEAQTIGGSTLTPVSSELNIGQKKAVLEIEADDDMHEWQQVLNFMPHFEVHEREGERYGKGYVELTSGKQIAFEFLLLPDSAWSLLTAPIAPVFGNKAGHRCSKCGFVFLKQADVITVTCPRCKHVADLMEREQSNKVLEAQFQDSQASPLVEAQPILTFLFDQGTGMTVEEIAEATNQQTSAVEYYCGQLEHGGFVRRCRFHGEQRRLYGSDWGYDLTQKGRGWVIKQSDAGSV